MTILQKKAAVGAAAALVLGGLAALPTGAAQAAPEDVVQVQILATNDFHGRILPNGAESGAAVIAGAVQELEADNPNTVFAAAGDLIGASTFESFISQDKPTIDALNAAGLDVSAVGNHEFDQGYDDLVNRVMAPYDATTNPLGGAEWEYIGANVKKKVDGTQADGIEASWMETFTEGSNTVDVGFVGAVTEHLDELVSPAGIADIEAADIVSSVNAEAADLKDAGAELVVLLVHEGAATTALASATDPASDFGKIVTGVSDDIGAIVSGHTHLAYNHTIDGMPVVSAGQYGVNLNQLVFDIDSATGEVEVVSQEILPLMRNEPVGGQDNWIANYAPDPVVAQIVQDAKDEADVLGAEQIGEIGAAFQRAKLSNGTTENRGGESTLGNLVAEVQRAQTPESIGGAEIAFMNPGGLRADMVGEDGKLTYKQAAVVQPFANTLVRMDLTGAQIKQVLEEQWQPDGASRPFLRLGISEGFTYTYDPSAARNKRVTGMWLDGTAIKPASSYSVTVNSFLSTGGDNFFTLNAGANKQDTGVTDLQAMVDYMAAAEDAVSPDFSQRSVGVSTDKASYAPGDTATVDLSSLIMTGPGDTVDEEVSVAVGSAAPVSVPVDATVTDEVTDEDGVAQVQLTIPAGTKRGSSLAVTVTGEASGTQLSFSLPVAPKVAPKLQVKVKPKKVKAKKTKAKVVIAVKAKGVDVTGKVQVKANGKKKTVKVNKAGKAKVNLGKFKKKGKKKVVVTYLGDDNLKKAKKKFKVKVTR
ncbi:5'-nucleotidase C-terminal domain-containing protein [Nocardioides alcanivorans]|uniref:5'-nucleotidase C-terminal domain-containing protein n=1 Tax=Nocardioides alcanivorans TaxID=2897352 RepID=UPI001F1D94F1|nr:5'-nucleotidase C-terminal domain-containing protein [Nocardioides alcanivorans]